MASQRDCVLVTQRPVAASTMADGQRTMGVLTRSQVAARPGALPGSLAGGLGAGARGGCRGAGRRRSGRGELRAPARFSVMTFSLDGEDGVEQAALAPEVVVQRGDGDAAPAGDVAQRYH